MSPSGATWRAVSFAFRNDVPKIYNRDADAVRQPDGDSSKSAAVTSGSIGTGMRTTIMRAPSAAAWSRIRSSASRVIGTEKGLSLAMIVSR